MHPVSGSSAWITLVDTLAAHGLSDQLSHSAPDASWLQDGGEPEDAPSVAQFEALLPAAYRSFVAVQGYPLIAAPSPLDYAFAFLPPLAARQASVVVADEAMDFNAAREARSAGEYEWRHVMFAGWNFADGDGWAFGHGPDTDAGEEPQVWLLEGGTVVEEVGSFEQWLSERATDISERLSALDAEALAAAAAREGDYAYGPLDLEAFDG